MKKKVWDSFLFVFLFGLMLSFGSSLTFAENTEQVTTVEKDKFKYSLYDIKNNQGEHLRYEAHIVGFADDTTAANQQNLVFPASGTKITYDGADYPITAIIENAFKDNTNIETIDFNNISYSIGKNAFSECTNLTTVSNWDNVTAIPDGAFYKCSNLATLPALPSNLISIGVEAFKASGLKTVSIPASVTSLGQCVFMECASLTSVSWPSTLGYIPSGTFNECTSLSYFNDEEKENEGKLVFTGNMEIGQKAFYHTKLKSIDFYSKVVKCDKQAFFGCTNLTTIENYSGLCTADGYDGFAYELFAYCTSLSVPLKIHKKSFFGKGCFSNTAITSIDFNSQEAVLREEAFLTCKQLTSVSNWNHLKTTVGATFTEGVPGISNSLFSECTALTDIPDFVSGWTLGNYAFANTGLTSLNFNKTSLTCGTGVFSSCKNLASVSQWDNITDLSNNKCIPANTFSGCSKLNSVPDFALALPIGDGALSGTGFTSLSFSDKDVIFGDGAFSNCKSLTKIEGWSKLTTVSNGYGISDNMFSGCSELSNIPSIPSGWQYIGKKSFSGCTKLPVLDFSAKDNITFGESPFYDTTLTLVFTPTEQGTDFDKLVNVSKDSNVKIILTNNIMDIPTEAA